jgi:hypothetical protein
MLPEVHRQNGPVSRGRAEEDSHGRADRGASPQGEAGEKGWGSMSCEVFSHRLSLNDNFIKIHEK